MFFFLIICIENVRLASASYGEGARGRLIRCRYGADCRNQRDSDHCAKYSH